MPRSSALWIAASPTGVASSRKNPLVRQVVGFRQRLLLRLQRQRVVNRAVGYRGVPFSVGGFQQQGTQVNPARPKIRQLFRADSYHSVAVEVAHRVNNVADVMAADGVPRREKLYPVVVVQNLGEFDGFHGFTNRQFARMS